MTDTAEFVPRRSARVASQKRDADEPIAKPTTTATKNGSSVGAKKAKTEPPAPKVPTLAVGDELPLVILKDQEGNDVNVSEIAKSSTVVIFGTFLITSRPGCSTSNLQCIFSLP